MNEQKVIDYIQDKRNNGASLMEITRMFRGTSLPDYFAEDSSEQVRRYAQLVLSRMFVYDQGVQQQAVTKKDIDYSILES
jgi:hypothetical protein